MDLIRVERRKGLEFQIRVRDQTLISDMAPGDGGQGAGFTPLELMAGAVGGCIAMAIQKWCQTCGHLGGVEASVAFQMEDDPKRMGTVVVDVDLPPGLPRNRRAALERIIEECPIRETLKRPPEVDVELVFSQQETPDRLRPVL